MRITYVLPRYGRDVAGGAEQAVRMFAERLVERGHEATVLTSSASSYVSWAPDLPSGTVVEGGVRVSRLPTIARADRTFALTHARAAGEPYRPHAAVLDHEWSASVGPWLPTLDDALDQVRATTDVLVVSPYMFTPTTAALRWATGRVPTLLTAAAHDEAAMRLVSTREALRRADAFAFYTPEEREVIEHVLRRPVFGEVIGIGIEPSPTGPAVPCGDRPFLLCLGRTDPGKGVHDLAAMFRELRRRRPDLDVDLVFAGDRVSELPAEPNVVQLGWVDEPTRAALLRSCVALVQPSYFESFSLVLCESWMAGRPVIANGTNPVLLGQVHRAEGGLCFDGYTTFEACVELVVREPALAGRLGRSGRAYVERIYSWDAVLARYEHLLRLSVTRHHERWGS